MLTMYSGLEWKGYIESGGAQYYKLHLLIAKTLHEIPQNPILITQNPTDPKSWCHIPHDTYSVLTGLLNVTINLNKKKKILSYNVLMLMLENYNWIDIF